MMDVFECLEKRESCRDIILSVTGEAEALLKGAAKWVK